MNIIKTNFQRLSSSRVSQLVTLSRKKVESNKPRNISNIYRLEFQFSHFIFHIFSPSKASQVSLLEKKWFDAEQKKLIKETESVLCAIYR